MKRLKDLWIELHGSFWFLPVVIVILSMALAMSLIEIDVRHSYKLVENWPRVFGAGAEASRGMLSTIANAVVSMMTVSFSMTLVTLALASSQYSSRILKNYMKSQLTQLTLGIFAGIFTYCLIVLRTIRGTDAINFIPRISVLFGFFLAIIGVGTLVLFIHHIASSIQASTILANIFKDTTLAVEKLFQNNSNEPNEFEMEEKFNDFNQAILSNKTGYIQSVDEHALKNFAARHNCIFKMTCGIGEFVSNCMPLLEVSGEKKLTPKETKKAHDFFTIKSFRSIEQDPLFGIRQIVDIALKALSPGINDTTTAIMCIDYIVAIMVICCRNKIRSKLLIVNGEVRIIAKTPDFKLILNQAFDQIRCNSRNNATVIKCLLLGHDKMLSFTADELKREILVKEKQKISDVINSVEFDFERSEIRSLFLKE